MSADYYEGGDGWVGPQEDGTYNFPESYGTVQPTDAGGGQPASYGQAVLDVFKYGVGAYAQYQGQQQMLDYKRWETTNFGASVQGKPAVGVGVLPGSNNGMLIALGIGAIVLVLVLKK